MHNIWHWHTIRHVTPFQQSSTKRTLSLWKVSKESFQYFGNVLFLVVLAQKCWAILSTTYHCWQFWKEEEFQIMWTEYSWYVVQNGYKSSCKISWFCVTPKYLNVNTWENMHACAQYVCVCVCDITYTHTHTHTHTHTQYTDWGIQEKCHATEKWTNL